MPPPRRPLAKAKKRQNLRYKEQSANGDIPQPLETEEMKSTMQALEGKYTVFSKRPLCKANVKPPLIVKECPIFRQLLDEHPKPLSNKEFEWKRGLWLPKPHLPDNYVPTSFLSSVLPPDRNLNSDSADAFDDSVGEPGSSSVSFWSVCAKAFLNSLAFVQQLSLLVLFRVMARLSTLSQVARPFGSRAGGAAFDMCETGASPIACLFYLFRWPFRAPWMSPTMPPPWLQTLQSFEGGLFPMTSPGAEAARPGRLPLVFTVALAVVLTSSFVLFDNREGGEDIVESQSASTRHPAASSHKVRMPAPLSPSHHRVIRQPQSVPTPPAVPPVRARKKLSAESPATTPTPHPLLEASRLARACLSLAPPPGPPPAPLTGVPLAPPLAVLSAQPDMRPWPGWARSPVKARLRRSSSAHAPWWRHAPTGVVALLGYLAVALAWSLLTPSPHAVRSFGTLRTGDLGLLTCQNRSGVAQGEGARAGAQEAGFECERGPVADTRDPHEQQLHAAAGFGFNSQQTQCGDQLWQRVTDPPLRHAPPPPPPPPEAHEGGDCEARFSPWLVLLLGLVHLSAHDYESVSAALVAQVKRARRAGVQDSTTAKGPRFWDPGNGVGMQEGNRNGVAKQKEKEKDEGHGTRIRQGSERQRTGMVWSVHAAMAWCALSVVEARANMSSASSTDRAGDPAGGLLLALAAAAFVLLPTAQLWVAKAAPKGFLVAGSFLLVAAPLGLLVRFSRDQCQFSQPTGVEKPAPFCESVVDGEPSSWFEDPFEAGMCWVDPEAEQRLDGSDPGRVRTCAWAVAWSVLFLCTVAIASVACPLAFAFFESRKRSPGVEWRTRRGHPWDMAIAQGS